MVERARQAFRLFYPLLLDGDDHEHNFELAGAAQHNIAIIDDGWCGGQLEVLVGGLQDLAHRAGGGRPALLDEQPHAQGYGLTRSGIPDAVKDDGRLIACSPVIAEQPVPEARRYGLVDLVHGLLGSVISNSS